MAENVYYWLITNKQHYLLYSKVFDVETILVSEKDSWTSSNLIYLHAFNRAKALMCTYLHIMVLWSHVAASVWLPLAMPVPHQDPVPLLHHGDNGSTPSTKLPWRPPSQDQLLGSCCTSFQRVFHSWFNCANGTWMESVEGVREGGRPQRTPLSPSCCSAPSESSTRDALRVWVKLVSNHLLLNYKASPRSGASRPEDQRLSAELLLTKFPENSGIFILIRL